MEEDRNAGSKDHLILASIVPQLQRKQMVLVLLKLMRMRKKETNNIS